MRLFNSTLYSTITVSLLAGCSGNMATSPSAAVPNAARLIADTQNRSAGGHKVRNMSYETVALQMNNWDTGPGPYYVTAGGPPIAQPDCGSGQVALHDDATTIGPEEKFTMVNKGNNVYAFRLFRSHYYITAVDGGDVSSPNQEYGYSQLSTNATSVGPEQIFTIIPVGRQVALETYWNTYVTAIAGCGTTNTVPFHTNATKVGPWEKFTLVPESVSCLTAACIYVANGNVNIYPATTNGDIAPVEQINSLADSVAVDANHNVYVTQGYPGAVNVFGAGTYGSVAPIQTITGSNTGLGNYPRGVAVDASGNIYVANWNDNDVLVYPAGANGNVAPMQTISGSNTGIEGPLGIALDGSNNIYVTNCCEGSEDDGGFVTVYAAGANGNVSPMQTISGQNTDLFYLDGIAVDATHNIYVTSSSTLSSSGGVRVFAAGANGNVAPIRSISGSNTNLTYPLGVALDAAGKVYVLDNFRPAAVLVFAANASGNVRPVQKIHGHNTEMKLPLGLAVR